MNYNNARSKNINNRTGNVAEYIKRWNEIISVNDGTRSYFPMTSNAHDKSCPFKDGEETYINITHPKHKISNLSKGFFTVDVEYDLQIYGLNPSLNDPHNLLKIAVYHKGSNQIFKEGEVFCGGSTDYNNNQLMREGFAYTNCKPRSEKSNKKNIYTLAENIDIDSDCIAGGKINLSTYKDGNIHVLKVSYTIPYDDLLAFSYFDIFPNSVINQIEFRAIFDYHALCWRMIDPREIKENRTVLLGANIDTAINDEEIIFKRDATQINNSALIINNATIDESTKKTTYSTGECRVVCSGMRITQFKATHEGFGVSEKSLNEIRDSIAANPLILPAQQMIYSPFNKEPSSSGIVATTNIPFFNTTCASLMFPKNANDITVFNNPMYQNVQLRINSVSYPDVAFSTVDSRFLQYQLNAAELDGNLECTKEFLDSIIQTRNDPKTGQRYVNTLSDTSSFMCNFQLERSGAGFCFDGIDSDGQNIGVELDAQPIYNGINDTYYNVDDKGTIHPPAPELWLCRDTYFVATVGGMKYYKEKTPEGY